MLLEVALVTHLIEFLMEFSHNSLLFKSLLHLRRLQIELKIVFTHLYLLLSTKPWLNARYLNKN